MLFHGKLSPPTQLNGGGLQNLYQHGGFQQNYPPHTHTRASKSKEKLEYSAAGMGTLLSGRRVFQMYFKEFQLIWIEWMGIEKWSPLVPSRTR